jgi:hypothetical protein
MLFDRNGFSFFALQSGYSTQVVNLDALFKQVHTGYELGINQHGRKNNTSAKCFVRRTLS